MNKVLKSADTFVVGVLLVGIILISRRIQGLEKTGEMHKVPIVPATGQAPVMKNTPVYKIQ